MELLSCELCCFRTDIWQHLERHNNTNKHKLQLITKNNNPKTTVEQQNDTPKTTVSTKKVEPVKGKEKILCKYCDKSFSFRQAMNRHIKYSCEKSKDEDLKELVRLMNSQLVQQRNEIHQQNNRIETQSKQIEKLMGKLEINYNSNNTINNIQNITLLNYKDTDVSHLTKDDYKKCIKRVCFCVMSLIEKIHFNPNKPENMNIYISNMKDKYVMVYEDGTWILKNKNLLDRLYDDKELMIEEWIEENKDKEMEQFFTKYLKNKKDPSTIEMINDEIKLMMYNKKNMIQCE